MQTCSLKTRKGELFAPITRRQRCSRLGRYCGSLIFPLVDLHMEASSSDGLFFFIPRTTVSKAAARNLAQLDTPRFKQAAPQHEHHYNTDLAYTDFSDKKGKQARRRASEKSSRYRGKKKGGGERLSACPGFSRGRGKSARYPCTAAARQRCAPRDSARTCVRPSAAGCRRPGKP